MDFWYGLFDVLILLSAALVLGVVCERFRQSPILGYLAAGTLLGPNALGAVSSGEQMGSLAELGVALLLFTIGLEFSWPRLRRLGPSALGGGAGQVVLTLALGASAAMLLGLRLNTALAIGAIVSLSSTAVVLRLLAGRAEIESSHGRLALGILLMQDIAVVPLVLLVTVLAGEGTAGAVGEEVLQALLWGVLLVAVLYVLLNKVVPKVLGLAELQRNRDLPILLAIVMGMGSAWGSHRLGLSPALGAFVAGMILAESPFATQIRADITPIKTLLVTLFFSSIGMLGDPAWFVAHLPSVLALVAAIVVGKALVVWGVLRLFKVSHAHALAAGVCLGQVGEFSFVLAAAGRGTVIDDDLFTLVISATIVTLFLTPYLVAAGPGTAARAVGRLRRLGLIAETAPGGADAHSDNRERIVIMGFGPAGYAVGEALARLPQVADRVAVVDLNRGMVRRAQGMGFTGHIGDATHAAVLGHIGIEHARAAVIAIPDPAAARAAIGLIRVMAPQAHIITRARYHMYIADLESGGAHEVVDEEAIVGRQMASRLRRHLRAAAREAPERDGADQEK